MKFKTFFKETANYQIDDFPEKWKSAIAESEELRVAIELMKKIKELFPTKEIYVVGGVPRDLLVGVPVDDVDLATNIPFEYLQKHFELRNISKNDSQPVYTILYKNYNFDLAKFREDSYGVAGRQNNKSTETDDFRADSARRDITIGSMGLDASGRIVDYQGGIDDLNNKLIRAVGDARERFKEDATRILRIFRFAAKMGFTIETETLEAAKEMKHLLLDPKAISVESISKEIYKAAKSGPQLADYLVKLDDAGILEDILPEFTVMRGFDHDPMHHPEGDSQVLGHILECLKVSTYKSPVINLAILFHDFGKATTRGTNARGYSNYHGHEAAGVPIVENIFNRLKFGELSASDKKCILFAVANHMMVHNLDKLKTKTLTKLILDDPDAWAVCKAVAHCDEASRGSSHYDENLFWDKIYKAEQKVYALGQNKDDLRLKIKKYVDGNKLMEWYPVFKKEPKKMRPVLDELADFILKKMENGEEPTEKEIRKIVEKFI